MEQRAGAPCVNPVSFIFRVFRNIHAYSPANSTSCCTTLLFSLTPTSSFVRATIVGVDSLRWRERFAESAEARQLNFEGTQEQFLDCFSNELQLDVLVAGWSTEQQPFDEPDARGSQWSETNE